MCVCVKLCAGRCSCKVLGWSEVVDEAARTIVLSQSTEVIAQAPRRGEERWMRVSLYFPVACSNSPHTLSGKQVLARIETYRRPPAFTKLDTSCYDHRVHFVESQARAFFNAWR